jgi:hypothetical protein
LGLGETKRNSRYVSRKSLPSTSKKLIVLS